MISTSTPVGMVLERRGRDVRQLHRQVDRQAHAGRPQDRNLLRGLPAGTLAARLSRPVVATTSGNVRCHGRFAMIAQRAGGNREVDHHVDRRRRALPPAARRSRRRRRPAPASLPKPRDDRATRAPRRSCKSASADRQRNKPLPHPSRRTVNRKFHRHSYHSRRILRSMSRELRHRMRLNESASLHPHRRDSRASAIELNRLDDFVQIVATPPRPDWRTRPASRRGCRALR